MARTAALKKMPAPEPDVPELPEQAIIVADTGVLTAFFTGIVPFFRRAGEIEQQSKEALDVARRTMPPKTADQDVTVQQAIKEMNVAKKDAEAHWNICMAISAFHRKLTAARGRPVENFTAAAALLQRLHNDFKDEQQRQARIEEERIRKAQEDQARQERDRELANLEAQAIAAEEDSADLSERERIFVTCLVNGWSDLAAAQKAGYRDPKTMAPRLMSQQKITDAISGQQEAQRVRQQVAAVQETPLRVRTEVVRADVKRAAGAMDRTYHYGDLLDEQAFVKAALAGTHGIPPEALMVNRAWLNEQAKALQHQVERYPGVRYRKETKTV